jgi:hypothetical protein
MAAASYNTDLTDLVADSAATGNWAALGGGASALNIETDYFIEGTRCVSKNAWAGADKGMVEDTTVATLTAASGKAVYTWVTHATPGSLATKASGGIAICLGSASNALNQYNYAGSDTIDYGAPWICAVVDPDAATQTSGTVTTANMNTYGARANLPTTGPTKGAPFGIDEIRYGRTIEVNDGVGAAANFTAMAVQNDILTNRWGQFQRTPGSAVNFTQQCRIEFGDTTNTTACLFTDSNKNITIADLEHVGTGFIEFDVTQASTVNLTNIGFTATSGANTKGNWVTTSAAAVNLTTCPFVNMGTFGFSSAYTVLGCTFRNCGIVTQNSATLTDNTFDSCAPVLSSAATLGSTSGNNFISGGTGYAIDLGTTSDNSTISWDNSDTGYALQAGTTTNRTIKIDFNGTLKDISVAAGASTPSVHNTGTGTVTVTAGLLTIRVTVTDTGGTPIENARVEIRATETVGTITTGDVILTGLTNASGIIEDVGFAYQSAFNPSGLDISIKARQGSVSPYKVPSTTAGTIVDVSGFTTIVALQPDE